MSFNLTSFSSSSSSERVCHLQCNFCNTILAVNVPCNNMLTIVTVRCGHCANLLSANIGSLLSAFPFQDVQKLQRQQYTNVENSASNYTAFGSSSSSSSSSKFNTFSTIVSPEIESRIPPIRQRVCHLQCNFCNTILAVNVPCNNMLTIVTVRCGHCANLLSANIGSLLSAFPFQDVQKLQRQQYTNVENSASNYTAFGSSSSSSSSKSNTFSTIVSPEIESRIPPIRPPEKRQRVPSAYNRFIKEEIQRIKASNPEISHREAFSTAAKNWAHFPHIHFGLKLEGRK